MAWDRSGAHSLPLEEFTRAIPPGWRPGLHRYPYQQYKENLKLWWRSRNVAENDIAAVLVAARLQGLPRRRAMEFRVERLNAAEEMQVHVGDDALVLPAWRDTRDIPDDEKLPSQDTGLQQFLRALGKEYDKDEFDVAGNSLDEFFDHRRKGSLLTYIHDFEAKYSEAASKAGLTINDVGRSHLLLKYSGIDKHRKGDLLLKIDGDWSRYQTLQVYMIRLAKHEDAVKESSGGYYGDEEYPDDDSFYDDESGGSWDE